MVTPDDVVIAEVKVDWHPGIDSHPKSCILESYVVFLLPRMHSCHDFVITV